MQSPNWLTTGESNPFLPQLLAAFKQANQIRMAVAFVKGTGLELIWTALEDALSRGTELQILTGDYLGLTEPAALRRLLHLETETSKPELKVFETRGKSFHPKAYLFIGLNPLDKAEILEGLAFIGSSNLSASALTDGIEWNLRIDHVENTIRFAQLFDAFDELFHHPQTRLLTPEWIDNYQARRRPAGSLLKARAELTGNLDDEEILPEPTSIQQEALVKLQQVRQEGNKRGLVVLATGLGKTWLSAFDAHQVCGSEQPRVLFVAHREEILKQAEATYLKVFPEAQSGWFMGTERDMQSQLLFASIQTLGRHENLNRFAPDAFDYIVVDEFHHAASRSYRQLLQHFRPRFLLGLTATPDRTDQADILSLCDGNLVHTVDLRQGIERRLLAPFVYFGIQDRYVDYARIGWRQGRFDEASLEAQVMTEQRAGHILQEWQARRQARTLAFCVSKSHADYMADYFSQQGVSAVAVHSTSEIRRDEALEGLVSGRWPVIFSVDLFNEGVDVPAIDTVMMLRPTESRILFLQQLGRGLRKASEYPDKRLHVLDFLGNHKAFLNRPQSLFGTGLSRESIRDFVQRLEKRELPLPSGCEMNYDLEVLDFFKEWSQTQKTNRILDLYVQLKESLGSRPSAQEMYQNGGDPAMKAIRQEWGSWLQLVAEQDDLNPDEQACLSIHQDFFTALEMTEMTKSFKMVSIQAMLELDGFNHPPDLEQLATQAFEIIIRRKGLRSELLSLKDIPWAEDIKTAQTMSPMQRKEWLAYWRKNPVDAWCKPKSKTPETWFSIDEQKRFVFKPGLGAAKIEAFSNLVQELVDYRLFKHLPEFQYKYSLTAYESQSYSDWRDWLKAQTGLKSVPLFATETSNPLQVQTRVKASNGYRLVCRHPEMEQAIIESVEKGLQSLTWTGLLFIVGYNSLTSFIPLHISHTGRMGGKHAVGVNISNIRKNRDKFARWGDGRSYRFGDLSQAIFKNVADGSSNGLDKWVQVMFSSISPPILRQTVQMLILPWHNGQKGPSGEAVSLADLEDELEQMISFGPNQLIH